MKKLLFITFITLVSFSFIKAQSITPDVISTGGDFSQGTNATLSWTLGETITETSETPSVTLTQGFQQNSYTIVNVYEMPETNINVSVFPNPTIDFVNIEINDSDETFEVWLIDMNGKTIFTENSIKNSTKINLTSFPASNYLLKIKSNDGNLIKSYKIIKNK